MFSGPLESVFRGDTPVDGSWTDRVGCDRGGNDTREHPFLLTEVC